MSESKGSFVLDLEDRRRLVVSECLMIAEKNQGMLYAMDFGTAILHNITNEEEVTSIADAANKRLIQIATRGY